MRDEFRLFRGLFIALFEFFDGNAIKSFLLISFTKDLCRSTGRLRYWIILNLVSEYTDFGELLVIVILIAYSIKKKR